MARDEQEKPYTVRYEEVKAMLLNEFLKEHGEVEKLEATVTELKAALQRRRRSSKRSTSASTPPRPPQFRLQLGLVSGSGAWLLGRPTRLTADPAAAVERAPAGRLQNLPRLFIGGFLKARSSASFDGSDS